ncbi:MAG: FtsH protease activity modulator HflK [Pseudomonadota bacterium]|nr:FtsH protease activity modulator HflK [Pseudomonadota bacterium]
MAWNEPGGGKDRDPWGNRRREGGPPDLDEVIRKLQAKLKGLFGGGTGGGGGPAGGAPARGTWAGIALILVIILAWNMTYVVKAQEQAIVLRFGAYVASLAPGLSVRWPRPIERVELVNVEQTRSIAHHASILTKDENIIDVEFTVFYRVKDVEDYAFNVIGPDRTVEQATESTIRSVIGKNNMDFVLTAGRGEIAHQIQVGIQSLLDTYQAGMIVASVNMQAAKPPEEVKSAFDDAIKAREDEQRQINEAETYRNDIIPKARGSAARALADSHAYKSKVIAEAEGDASRFVQLLVEYDKAPQITRERLYLDAMESVLANAPKVLLDTEGGNNLVYLPLDKLFEHRAHLNPPAVVTESGALPEPEPLVSERDERRIRRTR